MNDRIPPHSIELEQALLGSLLLSPRESLWEFVSDHPHGERYFYDLRHASVFRTILDLANARKPVDIATVYAAMTQRKDECAPEDASYIAALPDAASSGFNAPYYADQLRELYQRREIIRVATQATVKAFDGDADALEFSEREMLAIGQTQNDGRDISMRDLAADVIHQMGEAHVNRGRVLGVATGFPDIDRRTRGLKPGQMVVIGGRPSHGKTALGLNFVDYAAVNCGLSVGVFSLEMTKEELFKRLICARARVSSEDLETARLSDEETANTRAALAQLSKAKIHIQDPSGIAIYQLTARARRMMHRHKLDLLVVDYLQLLHGKNKQNRTQEMTEVSNGLKNLAKELGIPAIVLAQLNREYDKDGGREPRLSDLRDSGSIEQDADIVLLIHPKPAKDQQENADVPTQLLLKKHRNGPTGTIATMFRRRFTKFEEVAKI